MSTGRHKQERGVGLQPLDEVNGYQVRPGFYNRDGATATTKRCQLYDPFLWCDGMLSSVVPAAGKRAVCDPKISGGLSYWKHIFHVRFWIENRRV